ncbi:MAG TPA: LuxR C-terminal-related transcriptional regulator [Ktedonobacteraceae bacterium]|nr:LuxR C-terminal-related transcriptional regulator [Ktedonobacteraceae bacterium]
MYFHFPEFFALIHVYFAQQRYSLAVETLERCSKYFDEPDNMVLTIHFLSVYVAALHLAGKRELARTVAVRLLTLTEPEGYVRVYLDEGVPMKQVLQTLLNMPWDDEENTPPISRTYISTLLATFEQEEQKFAARGETPQSAGSREQEIQPSGEPGLTDSLSMRREMVETLSPQEQRVLRLLAAGRSNGEIASDLVVSINTIKAHVKKIYSKLHVSNRIAAIEVARTLHLL